MPTIHVKRGIEFRPDLFSKPDHAEWLDAVGKEIETKGITVKVGDGAAAVDVKNAADLKAAYQTLQQAAGNKDVKEYTRELLEALDDVVKPSSAVAQGDSLDFSRGSDLAKALGMNDSHWYASTRTDFGHATRSRPDGTLSVAGAMLTARAAGTAPVNPTPGPTTTPGADPLQGVPFIDASTFAGAQGTSGRDSLEVEAVRQANGLDKDQMYALMTAKSGSKTVLHKLQKNRDTVALGVGYQGMSLDELDWSSKAHEVRQMNPYISLTVEPGRMEIDQKTGDREISVGRDTFFDVFYATKDPTTGKLTRDLLDNNVMIRGRTRVDDESGKPTRVLIAMKIGTEVDSYGVKSAAKADIRTDSPTDDTVAKLDDAIKGAKLTGAGWYQQGAVIEPLAQAYTYLKSKGALKTYGQHKDTLVLEQAACLRQVRGRYHLNETEPQALLNAFKVCSGKVGDMLTLINASTTLPAADKTALSAACQALIDRSEIVKRATEGLKKIDPNMTVDKAAIDKLWPDQGTTSDKTEVKKRKVVADSIVAAFNDFTARFDNDTERKIAGNDDKSVRKAGSFDDVKDFLQAKSTASKFMTWAATQQGSGVVQGKPETYKAYLDKVNQMPEDDRLKLLANSGLASKRLDDITLEMLSPLQVPATLERDTTAAPFLAEFDAKLAGADKQAFIDQLGAFLASKGNDKLKTATDKDAVLGDIRKNLVFEDLEVLHRMVEEGATFGQTLWFDSARSAYCSAQRSGWSNFIIDSFDVEEQYNLKNGLALSKTERASRDPLDASKMIGFGISNDFQIELGYELPYTTAIDKAESAISSAAAGVFMDYALQKQGSGVAANDPASFTKYLDAQLKAPAGQKKAFLDDLAAFARSKGSPLAMDEAMMAGVTKHAKSVDLLMQFAQGVQGSNVNPQDPATLDTWLKAQLGWNQSQDKKTKFLNDLTDFFSDHGVSKAWTEKGMQDFNVKAFATTNQNQPTVGHAQLKEDLDMANFVWTTLLKTQESVADFRGKHVVDEAKKHGFDVKWEAATGSKGADTVEKVLG